MASGSFSERLPSDAAHVQRREFVRAQAECPVEVTLPDRPLSLSTHSLDISGNGLLVACPYELELGERVIFSLQTAPDRDPISGSGRVRRGDRRGELGIEIEQISGGDRRRLVRFVFECERRDRRRKLPGEDHRVT